MTRGVSWSALPAYTVNGYLPYKAIREGYFNQEAFLAWVPDDLLPHCNPYLGRNSIIVICKSEKFISARISPGPHDQHESAHLAYVQPFPLVQQLNFTDFIISKSKWLVTKEWTYSGIDCFIVLDRLRIL